jgi:hypothetical protein
MADDNKYLSIVIDGLEEISQEIGDATGQMPTLYQLLDVLAQTLRWGSSDIISDISVNNIQELSPKIKAGRGVKDRKNILQKDSDVSDFTDSVWVVASDVISNLSARIHADTGERPTIRELCTLLATGINQCRHQIVSDVNQGDVVDIVCKVKKAGKIKVNIADIVAIRTQTGKVHKACVLAKNRFGVAYGFFDAEIVGGKVLFTNQPKVRKYPIYSAESSVESGAWPIIGHDERLLDLFPKDPEIFHNKKSSINLNNPKIGPFGSGETSAGSLRDLTEDEAEEIGLLGGGYRQTYIPEFLEKRLAELIKW